MNLKESKEEHKGRFRGKKGKGKGKWCHRAVISKPKGKNRGHSKTEQE